MTKLLLIGLIFCISVSLNNAIELIPICKNATFEYLEMEVNSVHVLNYNRTFHQALNYTIDTNIDFTDYFYNKENARKMEHNRRYWNDKFLGIFSEIYINNPNKFHNITSKGMKNALEVADQFHAVTENGYRKKFYDNVMLKLKNSLDFHMTLESLSKNQFDQNNKTIDEIQNLLQSLDIEDNQIFALQHHTIDQLYSDDEIISLNRFILNRVGKIFFDLRSTGTLMMNIILPFNDLNYKEDSQNCITSDKLPKFYQNQKDE